MCVCLRQFDETSCQLYMQSSAIESGRLPRYNFIINRAEHHENRDSVEKTVSTEGPPIQLGGCRGAQPADRYNEHYVKNGAANNAAYLE